MNYLLFLLPFSFLFALEEQRRPWRQTDALIAQYNGYLEEAIQDHDWWAAVDYTTLIATHFPETPIAQESAFLLGESYYRLQELEIANQYFSDYLMQTISPKHFKEAVQYKFAIAEQFRQGVKKPLFGSHKLPKILSGEEDALLIYDDVIAAFPHDEISGKALLGKAHIQAKLEEYKSALETLDMLIRKFPKHELAAQAFLEKSKIYLEQSKNRSLDPALLDLAQLNVRKFAAAFPREERLKEVEAQAVEVRESFAHHLLDIGLFFEKTKKKDAAKVYYKSVLSKYPGTEAALFAQEQLDL